MDFTSNYKKKGMALDQEGKRIMRVKRRSVDQRSQRDTTFMRHRDVQKLAPLKENLDANVQRSTLPPTAAAKKPVDANLTRKEMLQKWKKERDIKKTLEKEKSKKPMFKVCKVVAEKKPTNLSTSRTQKNPAFKRTEVQTKPERRVTRASTRTSASKPVAAHAKPKAAAVPVSTRTTRQSTRLAASKPTVNRSAKSKVSSKPSTEMFALPSLRNITSDRGQAFQAADLGESFAPANFNFNLQFEPMSPASTQSFLFPGTATRKGRCSTPLSSMRRKREPSPQPLEISAISAPVVHSPKRVPAPQPLEISAISAPVAHSPKRVPAPQPLEISAISAPVAHSPKRVPAPQPLEISGISAPVVHSPKRVVHSPAKKHDVSSFRSLVVTETARLNDLSSKWETVQKVETLTEEVLGEIRSTIGKAQLLIDQRFKQFSGLVDNCEFGSGEKETNPSDLTGFWDMIFFQVKDVHGLFAQLDKLQDNNWQKEKPVLTSVKPKKVIKKSKPAPTVTKPNKDRDAARQRLQAIKAAMKVKVTRARASEQVVFEGGFFKVESPVRSPAPHCEAGSPFKPSRIGAGPGSNTNTPRIQSYTPKNARHSIQSKLCTPLSKLVLGEVVDKSLLNSSRDRTPRPSGVINREEQEDPFARYLKPSAISMTDSNSGVLLAGLDSPQVCRTSLQASLLSDVFTPPQLQFPTNVQTPKQIANDLICFDSPAPAKTGL
ncbi:disks large-associated protein 5-like isoform X1 [Asterias rubens]|uniref:disks large-associated protein 5-like isoform X1 n=1 Tax=Asterias rubens TaxID=7604 RepID=UPI00145541BC|nr:disks large-associated protein 5-like isoform X1 [Asterias rubens]